MDDPGQCLHHDCGQAGTVMILWKCRAGHRDERWYCDGHIAVMTEIAGKVLAGDWVSIPLCHLCHAPILPVVEGGGLTAAGHERVCWPLPGLAGPCPLCGWDPASPAG